MNDVLTQFDPLIQNWFATLGVPTDAQAQAWPKIRQGKNLLVTAPTGSGKTLTAFLWSINQFLTGEMPLGAVAVLYISPLKALNNDIQRNLLTPLADLSDMAASAGREFPKIRVLTRSGDTDQGDRRRMLHHPPEILITTPESLNLMLSSKGGQTILRAIRTVILDEIHSVVGNKRGVYLMSAVERLVPLAGEFQRIALSATVAPLNTVSAFVGGYKAGKPRKVDIVSSSASKQYALNIRYPDATRNRASDDNIWDSLAEDFVEKIAGNRSTLLFVNSRALCEKLTLKINNAAGRVLAWAHHGSLSREIRTEVEARLKSGELAAIVATSSLEMGIDIGHLDEVVLIQSPDSVSSSIQRIGRAGHGVGDISRCTIYPTHPRDFIEAAVLVQAVNERDIEPVRPVECPLDVLAQIVISMSGTGTCDQGELFEQIRCSYPYRNLTEKQFDLVINMLAGRYADNHIRELKPRVMVDRITNQVEARPGALMSLYMSGGVIPDRGYYNLRHADTNARIGELDEEFVWEANLGKVFSFGTQHWQIRKITHNDVLVGETRANTSGPPFWRAESLSRDFHYADRIGRFLESANAAVQQPGFAHSLEEAWHMEPNSAAEVVSFLTRQREFTGTDLPHRHHLLVEKTNTSPVGAVGNQMVLHTGWGARVNRPLAMAIEAGWKETFGEQPEVYASNECLVLQLPHDLPAAEVIGLAPARDIERLLRRRLEGSGFFGARFRENAGRALLLSKGRFNQRKPLWMSRLQSQKLMDSVLKYEDFPILLETWRTCLRDEFEIDVLATLLDELGTGAISLSEVTTASPSPFAQSVAWDQVSLYMYMDDQPKADKTSNLRNDLLQEVVFTPNLRPPVPRDAVNLFEEKRQRRSHGYGPETAAELLEWIKERTCLTATEFLSLGEDIDTSPILDRLGRATSPHHDIVFALEDTAALARVFADDVSLHSFTGNVLSRTEPDQDALETHLANWLQYFGPVSLETIGAVLPLQPAQLEDALTALVERRVLIEGALVEGEPARCWCDADNYEFLLRIMRRNQQPVFEARAGDRLPAFMFDWHTRFAGGDSLDRVYEAIERLRNFDAPAALWESELLPARLPGYRTTDLDLVLQEGNISWLGTGDKRVTFAFNDDLDLLPAPTEGPPNLFPDPAGRYDFGRLLDVSGKSAADLTRELWDLTWRGLANNNSMAALRRGIETGFVAPEITNTPAEARRGRRSGFGRWRNTAPFAGNWQAVNWPPPDNDLLDREERNKDRVRILLDRYGILFRELILRETTGYQWRDLFRSLRIMELSGEVLAGYFFRGIPGPQFVSPASFRFLAQHNAEGVFWLCATDPLSLAGLQVPDLRVSWPRRVPGNHIAFAAGQIALVSERMGRKLTIVPGPEDPQLPLLYGVLRHLLTRSFDPVRKVVIETINDVAAPDSVYLASLRTGFDVVVDYKSVYIQRRIDEL